MKLKKGGHLIANHLNKDGLSAREIRAELCDIFSLMEKNNNILTYIDRDDKNCVATTLMYQLLNIVFLYNNSFIKNVGVSPNKINISIDDSKFKHGNVSPAFDGSFLRQMTGLSSNIFGLSSKYSTHINDRNINYLLTMIYPKNAESILSDIMKNIGLSSSDSPFISQFQYSIVTNWYGKNDGAVIIRNTNKNIDGNPPFNTISLLKIIQQLVSKTGLDLMMKYMPRPITPNILTFFDETVYINQIKRMAGNNIGLVCSEYFNGLLNDIISEYHDYIQKYINSITGYYRHYKSSIDDIVINIKYLSLYAFFYNQYMFNPEDLELNRLAFVLYIMEQLLGFYHLHHLGYNHGDFNYDNMVYINIRVAFNKKNILTRIPVLITNSASSKCISYDGDIKRDFECYGNRLTCINYKISDNENIREQNSEYRKILNLTGFNHNDYQQSGLSKINVYPNGFWIDFMGMLNCIKKSQYKITERIYTSRILDLDRESTRYTRGTIHMGGLHLFEDDSDPILKSITNMLNILEDITKYNGGKFKNLPNITAADCIDICWNYLLVKTHSEKCKHEMYDAYRPEFLYEKYKQFRGEKGLTSENFTPLMIDDFETLKSGNKLRYKSVCSIISSTLGDVGNRIYGHMCNVIGPVVDRAIENYDVYSELHTSVL